MIKKAVFSSLFFLVSAAASAQGGYVGLSVGQTDVDLTGFDDGRSLAIVAGFKINENFAMEGSFVDLGEAEDDIPPVWTLAADGINLAAVGIIPVNETVDIFGKLGVFMWDLTLDQAGAGEIGSNDGTDLSFGFGIAANLTKQFGLVFEYQNFELDSQDVTNMSIGARINF